MLAKRIYIFLVFVFFTWGVKHALYAQEKLNSISLQQLEESILELMDKGDIPGLSVVIIKNGQQIIKNYGYSNLAHNQAVTEQTLFQIGSCSKAFTALAVTKLENEKLLDLDKRVSDYLPWFSVYYRDQESDEKRDTTITLRQLLHHTSGIPWNTISQIPESAAQDALEQTVRQLIGQELKEKPGEKYEYATINYDVLALIIEKLSKQSFESYIQENVFAPLDLLNTSIGMPLDSALMSQGYKIGFFSPMAYDAPVFKGNNAAGYIISDATDIAKWLSFQMGLIDSDLYSLAHQTHQRDETVPLHGMYSYARGWEVALDGTGEIWHGGLNPNFTSHIAFRPNEKIGVAVLANSNSTYTSLIGNLVMKSLAKENMDLGFDPGARGDTSYSLISLALLVYVLFVLAFIVLTIRDITAGKRSYSGSFISNLFKFIKGLGISIPFLLGIFFLPKAIADFNWESIIVWTPFSFSLMVIGILTAIGISYLAFFINLYFPEKNIYKRKAPLVLLLSILSGLSNMVAIILVTSSLGSETELMYLIAYYSLAIGLYLLGRFFVQKNLIKFTRGLVYDLRTKLIDKIFSSSYYNFERIDRGRVYTALNDDVNTLGQSTNLVVTLITSIITATGAFLYLASIAFWATCLTIFLIFSLASIYYFVSQRTNIYFEQARDEQNIFMRLVNSLIDGYKELSLHIGKKLEYKTDVTTSAGKLRDKLATADIRFLKAFLVGESLLVVLLGFIAFGIPEIFTDIPLYVVMSFVIVLLYLIGPINGILAAVPAVMQIKIAWNRINGFLKEIPATLDLNKLPNWEIEKVESIKVEGVTFSYKTDNEEEDFCVGPINFEASAGDIIFIIGGNGSGKTTFSKLLTGLYEPDAGQLIINDREINSSEVGEYFSTSFSPPFLFEKLYDVDLSDKQVELQKYLKLLRLENKLEIVDNQYNTINLSSGQRKRLVLLQCYLEDRPIYLFDEWAADQDPEFRKFFYHELLPQMKQQGKIVIAITHDDHYFGVADKVFKMNQGKLEVFSKKHLSPVGK